MNTKTINGTPSRHLPLRRYDEFEPVSKDWLRQRAAWREGTGWVAFLAGLATGMALLWLIHA